MRCSCGYGAEWHPGAGLCPLCACGRVPDEHLAVADPPAPLLTWAGKQLAVCPGKPLTAAGKLPTLRRGSFSAAGPAEPFRTALRLPPQPEIAPDAITALRAADVGLPAAATHPDPPYAAFPMPGPAPEALSEPQAPPRVPARPAAGPGEIAPRALTAGMRAAALGWTIEPHYWVAASGVESSLLTFRRDRLLAWAWWERVPGGTWKSAGAYAWAPGEFPVAVGVTRLSAIIAELG